MMAECFPRMDVGNMHFYNGSCDCTNGIGNRHRSVGIRPGIDDDAVKRKTYLVDFINELPFVVALKIMQVHIVKGGYQNFKIILKSLSPVHFRFAYAKEIEVGSVEDEELHMR